MWLCREGVYDGFVYGKENAHTIRGIHRFVKRRYREPVLLLGNSGAGKTHLLTAIKERLLLSDPHLSVRMESGAEFTEHVSKAVVNGDLTLIDQYFDANVLLLDDLTCMCSKFSTQQELLIQLRRLQEHNIQVLLTTLPDLEQSMQIIYHLFSGNILEIKRPTERTARRIISYHARKKGVSLKAHQIERIMEKSCGNGFLIKGAITQQHFFENVPLF